MVHSLYPYLWNCNSSSCRGYRMNSRVQGGVDFMFSQVSVATTEDFRLVGRS